MSSQLGQLAHVHVNCIQFMTWKRTVDRTKADVTQDAGIGKDCMQRIATNAPVPKGRVPLAQNIVAIEYTDVCGKLPVPLLGGSLYFVGFISERSRYYWIYAIKYKAMCSQLYVDCNLCKGGRPLVNWKHLSWILKVSRYFLYKMLSWPIGQLCNSLQSHETCNKRI